MQREHGQAAVDMLIREFDMETLFGFRPGTEFHGAQGGKSSGPGSDSNIAGRPA